MAKPVDWKGFFSNPMTYQLPEEDFQAAYQELIHRDENMAGFTPDDHMTFIKDMQRLNPMRPPMEISPAGKEVARTFAPLAEEGVDPKAFAVGAVTQQIGQDFAPAATVFAEAAKQALPLEAVGEIPGAREIARGAITTGPETLMGLLPGVAAQIDALIGGPAQDARSNMWNQLGDVIDFNNTTAIPMFVESMSQALEQAGDVALGPQVTDPGMQLTDVSNVGEAFDYLARFAVQGGASSAPIMAASLIPIVGKPMAYALSHAFVTGELQQEMFRETGEALPGAEAAVRQAPAAVLEYLGAKGLLKGLAGPGRKALGKWIANRGINIAEAMGKEGATENLQQIVTILNKKDVLGEPLDPTKWSKEDWAEVREATVGGAVGGLMFGGAGALRPTPAEQADRTQAVQAKIKDIIKIYHTPREAGREGLLQLTPQPTVEPGEARHRGAPKYLDVQEKEAFIRGEQLDVVKIAERLGRPEEEIAGELDAAEREITALTAPERQPAQPTPEGEEVVAAIGRGLEQMAVEAEEAGQQELAAARRKAAGKVQVVEATTDYERGLLGLAEGLGGAPQVHLYTQPAGDDVQNDGVFVRPGLIAIDVSQAGAMPKTVVGTLFHELVHNIRAVAPEVYAGTIEAIKKTELWERGRQLAIRNGLAEDQLTDEEIFANVTQLDDVTANLLRAVAEYADVEDLAKAPSSVRAVAEWLAKWVRTVLGKISMSTDVTGLNLRQMERLTALTKDPGLQRNAAKATLEIIDMLKAQPGAVPVADVDTKFSKTFTEFRQEVGGGSVAGVISINTEIGRFYEKRREIYRKMSSFPGYDDNLKKASEAADKWVRENMVVLEDKDLNHEQKLMKDFGAGVGTNVTFYMGDDPGTGGFSVFAGHVWVNAKSKIPIQLHAVIVHELTHDLKKRDHEAWSSLLDLVQKKMPGVWELNKINVREAYKHLPPEGERIDDEVLAHVIHGNAEAVWNAIVALGREKTAPAGFKRLVAYLGEMLKRAKGAIAELFGTPIESFLGIDVDITDPADEVGMAFAQAMQRLTSGTVGDFTALDIKDVEVSRETQQREIVKAIVAGKVKGAAEEKFIRRIAQETDVEREPEDRQIELFSRRVGYPPAAQSPQQLGQWRKRLAKMAFLGQKGKFWYELSSGAMLQMTGGNLAEARKFARVVAVYSPRVRVSANWHQAMTAWQRYKAGYSKKDFLAESLGLPGNHKKAAEILYEGAEWEGEKTNSFFANLFTLLDDKIPDRATVDVWMMRAFGFSGDAPSPQQYREMEKETKLLAKKLGVETHQAQAMVWVYAKTVWESLKNNVKDAAVKRNITTHVPVTLSDGNVKLDRRGKALMVTTPEYEALYRELFNKATKRDLKADVTQFPISSSAMTTFATGLKAKVAVISQEAIPGIGFLADLADADIATKVGFTLAVEQALMDEFGNDIIAEVMGFGPVAEISTMLLGNSAYYNEGRVQINPSRQIKVPAGAERAAESTFTFDAASRDRVVLYATIRALLTGQWSTAGYRRFVTPGALAHRNMADLDIGNRLNLEQQEELVKTLARVVKSRSAKLQGWEIALYPTENGVAFMNTPPANMSNAEFQDVVTETLQYLSFSGKMKTFQADTFYVQSVQDEEGKVDTYDIVIQGSDRKALLKRVEDRVADKLAKVYTEYAGRGFGEAPDWAIARTRPEAALGRDVKTYPHFWHFSKEEVTDEGLLRERAGTGAAGRESARFVYDPETGKLDPESAVVHLYTPTARAENVVVTQAKYINKVIADLKLIPLDSDGLAALYAENEGDPTKVMARLKELGYDGMVDERRGMVQVNRDIDVSELVEGHEMTPKERLAWKGALSMESIAEEQSYDHLQVPAVRLTPAAVEHVASALTDDGTAYFPKGTDEQMVKQYFDEVRSTSVGLVATKPRRPQFSQRVVAPMSTPQGTETVDDAVTKYGTDYRPHSGPSWHMPHMSKWDRFVKRIGDSFVQFERINALMADEGIIVEEHIDVRLAEELYHGKVQEQTARIQNKYIDPALKQLRAMAKRRTETEAELMAKFDLYLHALHAKERNAHIREAFHNRKLQVLQERKDKLQGKMRELGDEILEAEGEKHWDRLNNAMKMKEMQLVKLEREIERTLNQPDLNSGMTDEEATGIMKQTRLDKLHGDFSRLAKRYVHPMLKERLDALLAEGLVTQDEYDNVAIYKNYVPLKGKAVEGDIDEMLDYYNDLRSSNGYDIRGPELQYVTGRESDSKLNPIFTQSVVDSLSAFDRIERNRVGKALLELAERYPNDKLWEINKRVSKRIFNKKTGTIETVENWWARNEANVTAVKRDGETFYITLKDAGMAEAMKGLGIENLWKWVRALRVVMRTLAQLYTTWSPEFIMTNFARDWQQAIVSATTDMGKEAAVDVAKNSHKAVRGILAANFPDALGFLENDYTQAYHELKEQGGKIGFFGMRGIRDMHKGIIKDMKTGHAVATMRGARQLGNYISSINEATENGIRLATYVAARKQGASQAEAASLARNVTVNFNRRGDIGGAIGAGWLFFNAGVQGINRFYRSMKTPSGQKMAAMYIGMSFLVHTWSRAIMGEDDDGEDLYDKVSDFTKGRNWVIGYDKGKFVQIPLPYGFGVWGQLGKELEHLIFSGDDRVQAAGEAAVRMLSGLTTHFSPIGETSFNQGMYAMARPVIPTLVEPWTDLLANETYWGGKIYPAKAAWDRRSRSARVYTPRTVTGRALMNITKYINRKTGGSEYRGGVVDISSNSLTYLLDSYIGPTGRFIKRPFELTQKFIQGDDNTWNDWIILRRFLGETAPMYYVPGEFYDAVDDVKSAVEEQEYIRENGNATDYDRWEKRHGWKVGMDKLADQAQRNIRNVRKQNPDSRETRDRVLALQRSFVIRYLQSERR